MLRPGSQRPARRPGRAAEENAAAPLGAWEARLDDPAGSVNGGTGQLTFAIDTNDASADASGTIAYVEFTDSDGTVQLSLPAQQGGSAVSGYAVFNTLTVIAGAPLEIVSATIG